MLEEKMRTAQRDPPAEEVLSDAPRGNVLDPVVVRAQRLARIRQNVAKVTEVDAYLNLDPIDKEQNPLAWWRERVATLPFLSKLARV